MNAKTALRWALNEMEMRLDPSIPSVRQAIDAARSVLAPKRRASKVVAVPGKSRKERRRMSAKERITTRRPVEARANGRCEASALGGCGGALTWDHFFGRGKVPPSVELEWMLCWTHHQQKDHGTEDGRRLKWLRLFLIHAQFYGYQDAISRCERAIALEEAQHPEARKAAAS